MKLKHLVNEPQQPSGRLVARFGQAALLQQNNGRYHLAGGSRADQAEAREWISLFLHEALLSPSAPGRASLELEWRGVAHFAADPKPK